MRDVIPDALYRLIRDRYLAGVADAEAKFRYGRAEEESLTGTLCGAIATPGPMTFHDGERSYSYEVAYQKVRGRGAGAPEKRTGADGIFQIKVSDADGTVLRQKGLPFQAKKEWLGTDQNLVRQCTDMMQATGEGLVIDYSEHGYRACRAVDVIQSRGRIDMLREMHGIRDLGHILADDFLECHIGREGLFFDPDREIFVRGQPTRDRPEHVVTTKIERFRRGG